MIRPSSVEKIVEKIPIRYITDLDLLHLTSDELYSMVKQIIRKSVFINLYNVYIRITPEGQFNISVDFVSNEFTSKDIPLKSVVTLLTRSIYRQGIV